MSRRRTLTYSIVLATAFTSWASSGHATVVTASLVIAEAAPSTEVHLTFTAASAGNLQPYTATVVVPERSATTLTLPKGSVWEVRAEAEGYWAQPATVAARGASAAVTLTLYRTGEVTGRLALPRDAEPPESTTLWFTPAPDAGGSPPQGSIACTVALDLAFTCPAPAGEIDLKLRARGFVSHFLWGVTLPPGGELPLGTLKLVQGGSLVGWAEPAGHGISPDRCTAELQRLTSALLASRADLERATRPLARAPLSERGFFHLPDVAPGEYALEVTCPGYAPARLAPVRVSENAETTLSRTIQLEHELALEVRVEPATDPAGKPLHLTLDERRDATPGIVGTVLELEVPRDGVLTTPALPPGRYRVTVKGSDGTKWFNDDRLLDAASGPLEITPSLVRVQGHVRAGDDPVAGTVRFGSLDGRLRVPLASDHEGAFAGVLPHAGSWQVEVVTADGTRLRVTHPVEVEEPPRGEASEVDVELPDTRLRGRVVDDDSRPVAGADVTVASLADDRKHSLQSLAMTKSDGDGGFVLRGLAPGKVELHATDGERTSRPQHVQLPEDGEPPGVTVVLERNQLIVGHVLSPQGPVVGASVQLTPQVTGVSVTVPVSTDIHGRFEIEQPTAASLANLLVQAPGFPAVLRQVVLDPGSNLDVAVGGAGGTLAVELGDDADPLRTMVAHDGAMAPATDLSGWARAHGVPFLAGSALNLPAMAPGDYSVCTAGAYLEPPTSGLVCTSGTLPPGGELRLRLPPP